MSREGDGKGGWVEKVVRCFLAEVGKRKSSKGDKVKWSDM